MSAHPDYVHTPNFTIRHNWGGGVDTPNFVTGQNWGGVDVHMPPNFAIGQNWGCLHPPDYVHTPNFTIRHNWGGVDTPNLAHPQFCSTPSHKTENAAMARVYVDTPNLDTHLI